MPVRVYQDNLSIKDHCVELSDQAAIHVAKVLRLRVGESVVLFDGSGLEYQGEIAMISKKAVLVTIVSQKIVNRESPLELHLFQGISKGERMDWVMQKAVELGVTAITPLITQHGVVKLMADRLDKKLAHWQRIAISACEQCGRNLVPKIHQPQQFTAILTQPAALKLILHPTVTNHWRQLTKPTGKLMLLIGPEGGFATSEVDQALATGWTATSLGPRILRTETAAIAALATLQAWWGDF